MKRNPSDAQTSNPNLSQTGSSAARPTTIELERYLDFTVVDRDNNKIGTMDAIWEDSSGQPAYLGVKTGWLGLGRTHVIPVYSADVSETTRKIRLPYTVDVVKNAPAFEEQIDIDDNGEAEIERYYRQHGYQGSTGWSASQQTTDTAKRTERTKGAAGMRTDESDEIRMPISQEHVDISKRQVEAGGVRLRKIIRTERVNQPVDLQREEIVVERVPVTERTPSRTDVAFREEEVYIPLRREEAVVNKRTETTEEVRVSKKRDVEHRDVSETVRKEDVEVDRTDQGSKINRDRPL